MNDLKLALGPASTASTLASSTLWISHVASRRSVTISATERSTSLRLVALGALIVVFITAGVTISRIIP